MTFVLWSLVQSRSVFVYSGRPFLCQRKGMTRTSLIVSHEGVSGDVSAQETSTWLNTDGLKLFGVGTREYSYLRYSFQFTSLSVHNHESRLQKETWKYAEPGASLTSNCVGMHLQKLHARLSKIQSMTQHVANKVDDDVKEIKQILAKTRRPDRPRFLHRTRRSFIKCLPNARSSMALSERSPIWQ